MVTCNRFRATVAMALLAISASACDVQVNDKGLSLGISEGRARDEWTRTYTLADDGRLELENGNGDIQVGPAAGDRVEVVAEREVRARSDEAAAQRLKELKMDEQVSPALVRVAAPRTDDGFRESVRINYRVSLPAGTTAALRTQNGDVRLEDVQGSLRVSSTNGSIGGRGVAGSLEASTVNGGITMTLAAVTGDIRLTTVNGGIRVDVPVDADATLEAGTVNGGILVAERLPLTGPTRERLRVSGRLNAGGPAIQIQTTNGGIRIGVAGGAASETSEGLRNR